MAYIYFHVPSTVKLGLERAPVEDSSTQTPPLPDTSVSDDAGQEHEPAGETVTEVTGDAHQHAATNGHTNGQANGHTNGTAAGMLIPCANCDGTVRWNDRGILRCVACWPKEMC